MLVLHAREAERERGGGEGGEEGGKGGLTRRYGRVTDEYTQAAPSQSTPPPLPPFSPRPRLFPLLQLKRVQLVRPDEAPPPREILIGTRARRVAARQPMGARGGVRRGSCGPVFCVGQRAGVREELVDSTREARRAGND